MEKQEKLGNQIIELYKRLGAKSYKPKEDLMNLCRAYRNYRKQYRPDPNWDGTGRIFNDIKDDYLDDAWGQLRMEIDYVFNMRIQNSG